MANKHLPCTGPRTVNCSYFSWTTSQFCYMNFIYSVFLWWPPKLGFWSTWTPKSTSVWSPCLTDLASSTTAAHKMGTQSLHRWTWNRHLPKRCSSIHSNDSIDALTVNTQPGKELVWNRVLTLRESTQPSVDPSQTASIHIVLILH